MEILFIFDKCEPTELLRELKAKYNFDPRNGLSEVMVGSDWYEIGRENRVIHQIERHLNLNLSLLDYWNTKVYENELEIDEVHKVLEELKNQIEKNPGFYEKIKYGFNSNPQYLKSQFLCDILYLINRLEINKINGAKNLKYDAE